MPRVFKFGKYIIYFWTNENRPLEPVHVHIAEGTQQANATKVWITSTGETLLCNNNSKIPDRALRNMMDMIEAQSNYIIDKWKEIFGEVKFYC